MINASNIYKTISSIGNKSVKLFRDGVVVGNVGVVLVGVSSLVESGIIGTTRVAYIGIPSSKITVEVGDVVGSYGVVTASAAMIDGVGKVVCYKVDIDE